MERNHQRLSILFIGTQMATGGAQKLLLEQARWFQSKGHQVTAVFFYDRDNLHRQWGHQVSFPLYNLKAFEPGVSLMRKTGILLRGLLNLWTLMRGEHFDVAITFTHDSNVLGLPLAWLARLPVRIATHLGTIRTLPRWRERANTWLINSGIGQVLVAASEKTCQDALSEGVHRDRVVMIPNGITPFEPQNIEATKIREELGIKSNDIFLLAIGRLVYEKGHEVFIEAVQMAIRRNPHIKAGICGDGSLKESLETQISQSGLLNHVKLLGRCDSIAHMLAAADVFVLPSRSEGLSLALLEAMAAGLPVIATRVQGVEEVVEDGVHGFLVPLEDPDKLNQAILAMTSNPDQRKKMGMASRSRVLENYTTDHMCERYLTLIKKYLEYPRA